MPQDYFSPADRYDRKFWDRQYQGQQAQNRRFPNTYNRNQPFRPFCPPQNGCFPPQFGPQWGNQCNPCDLKKLDYDFQDKADIRATELQKKAEKNKLWTNLGLGVLGFGALLVVSNWTKNIIGTPAIKDSGGTTTTTGGSTITTTGEPTAAELTKQREDAVKTAKDLEVKNKEAANTATKKAEEYGKVGS